LRDSRIAGCRRDVPGSSFCRSLEFLMHFAAGLSRRLRPILIFLLPAFIVNPVIAGDDSRTLPVIPAGVDLQSNGKTPQY
jgi:hypothetical protein